jgi:hypothetical protein
VTSRVSGRCGRQGVLVGVLRANPFPTSLEAAGEMWSGRIRTGPGGWWAEFSRSGIGTEVLTYRPKALPGGNFHLGAARYRLRLRFLRVRWTLRNDSREELGTIDRIDRTGTSTKIQLSPAAATEPRLVPLLLASCLALVWDQLTPRVGAGGDGGA